MVSSIMITTAKKLVATKDMLSNIGGQTPHMRSTAIDFYSLDFATLVWLKGIVLLISFTLSLELIQKL